MKVHMGAEVLVGRVEWSTLHLNIITVGKIATGRWVDSRAGLGAIKIKLSL
jgi:hypothetical protein